MTLEAHVATGFLQLAERRRARDAHRLGFALAVEARAQRLDRGFVVAGPERKRGRGANAKVSVVLQLIGEERCLAFCVKTG